MPRFASFAFSSLITLFITAALFTGCASDPAATRSAAPPTTSPEPSPFPGLQRGMTADQVRALLGSPASIAPGPSRELKSEVWTYNRPAQSTTTQAATTVRQVDAVDPISGQSITVPEPVYQTVVVRILETVELLMVEGKLTEWKTTREAARSY